MLVEQIYTGCLSQGAYYIESNGEAVVIDPLRESEPYISRAAKGNAKIKYVLETHFHADFVSGHIDLARATGAQIVFGPAASTQFEAHIAKDGERLKVGALEIEVITPVGDIMPFADPVKVVVFEGFVDIDIDVNRVIGATKNEPYENV